MGQTLFRGLFLKVCRLYLRADWDMDKFVQAQILRDHILTARNQGGITEDEYRVLHTMVSYIIDTMREVLRKAGGL